MNRNIAVMMFAILLFVPIFSFSGLKEKSLPGEKYPPFLKSVVVPMVTPFNEDKSLDEAGLRALVEWFSKKKVGSLFTMGGSGEFRQLKSEERKRLIDITVQTAKKRVGILAGVGSETVEETIDLAKHAEKAGADGATVIVPTNIPSSEDSLYDYYKKIDDAVNIPIVIYDPKGKGEFSITPALMERFVSSLNIVGIKYRSSDMRDTMLLVQAAKGKVAVMSGIEMYFLPTLSVGGVGVVGGGCNVYPGLIHAIYERFNKGDHKGTLEAQLKLEEAMAMLDKGPWPLSGKVVLRELGLPIKPVTRGDHKPIPDEVAKEMGEYFRKLDQEYP